MTTFYFILGVIFVAGALVLAYRAGQASRTNRFKRRAVVALFVRPPHALEPPQRYFSTSEDQPWEYTPWEAETKKARQSGNSGAPQTSKQRK